MTVNPIRTGPSEDLVRYIRNVVCHAIGDNDVAFLLKGGKIARMRFCGTPE